jgi:hypothetical protein
MLSSPGERLASYQVLRPVLKEPYGCPSDS